MVEYNGKNISILHKSYLPRDDTEVLKAKHWRTIRQVSLTAHHCQR